MLWLEIWVIKYRLPARFGRLGYLGTRLIGLAPLGGLGGHLTNRFQPSRGSFRCLAWFLEHCWKGYGVLWRKWVYRCLSSTHFLIIINGSPKGFFLASRGLRQGDPLSSFFFTIAADKSSSKPNQNLFKGFQMGFEKVNVFHLRVRGWKLWSLWMMILILGIS